MSTSSPTLTRHLADRIKKFRDFPVLRQATVTIQLTAPLHIGSGSETDRSDAGVVLDANGIATIPGSSLKGVLRAAYRAATGLDDDSPDIIRYFGFQHRKDGQGARIRVTWGRIHNAQNQPVAGLLDPDAIEKDPVLASAAAPELRDHARINACGIAENKFDDLSIVAGHRFTFRIEMDGTDDEADRLFWATLLGILRRGKEHEGEFRLGGKTRRGFGSVKILDVAADPDDFSAPQKPRLETLCDKILVPDRDCFWMFGGGADLVGEGSADSAPVRAIRVKWDNDLGSLESNLLLVPGSSVKGPLRHRTRFHLCRLLGLWAEHPDPDIQQKVERALHLLFGNVELDKAKMPAPGRTATRDVACAGRVFIDDLYLADQATQAMPVEHQQNHVTIDRATGGAFDHHLFSDRPLHGGGFRLHVRWLPPGEDLPAPDRALLDQAKKALDNAIEDLKSGLLALGAHGNRGYGWFRAAETAARP